MDADALARALAPQLSLSDEEWQAYGCAATDAAPAREGADVTPAREGAALGSEQEGAELGHDATEESEPERIDGGGTAA